MNVAANLFSLNINMFQLYIIVGAIIALFIAVIILLIIVIVRQNKLKRTYYEFMSGANGKTMEQVILKRFKDIDRLLAADAKRSVAIDEINESLSVVAKKIGIVKYDAFNQMGGKLSFALTILNEHNTGFVMNSMYSSEGCYVYIKDIIKGKSFIELGKEEKKSVDIAVKSDSFDSIEEEDNN